MLRGDSSVWPTRFFGLAKEHANKPPVVAAGAKSRPDELLEMREATMQAAEDQARKDLGANYELVARFNQFERI
jgi:hypothetical protein